MNIVDFFSAEVVAAAGSADSDEFEMGQAYNLGRETRWPTLQHN